MAQKIKLKKSNIVDKMPIASTMDYGEVYVNYASGVGKSFLTTVKDGKGSIAKFMEKEYNDGVYAAKNDVITTMKSTRCGIPKEFLFTLRMSAEVRIP